MNDLLQISSITCRYGGFTALTDFSLTLAQGACACIVGPNGAGKSTLLSNIAGLFQPREGSIRLNGEDVTKTDAETRARSGIAMVPEGRRIFGSLTVAENLRLGATLRRGQPGVADDLQRVFEYFPILRERHAAPAGKLSGGEQQMLAIARALMGRPRLLMIDEPSLGLAPMVVATVYDVLRRLRSEQALTMLIVEQSTSRVADIADSVQVLRSGRSVWSGRLDPASRLADLDEAYFGFDAAGSGSDIGAGKRSTQ